MEQMNIYPINRAVDFTNLVINKNLAKGNSSEEIANSISEIVGAIGLGYGYSKQRNILTDTFFDTLSKKNPFFNNDNQIFAYGSKDRCGSPIDRCGNPIKKCGNVIDYVKDKCGNVIKTDRCGNQIVGEDIGNDKIKDKHGDIYYK